LQKKAYIKISIAAISLIVFAVVLFSIPSLPVDRNHENANVVIFSKGTDTPLITSLNIDTDAINLTVITKDNINQVFNDDLLKSTHVVIVDRYMPTDITDLHLLRGFINGTNGTLGLLFFGGLKNDLTETDDFSDEQINVISQVLPLTLSASYNVSTDESSNEGYKIQIAINSAVENQLITDKANSNLLVRHISWTSSPIISKRILAETANIKATATQIIESIEGDYSLISEWTISNGGTVIFFGILINGYNDPFVVWPYFNYLMYVSVFHANPSFLDTSIESFAEWPFSPIPHLIEIIMWFSMIGVLWIITFRWFFKLKKEGMSENDTELK